ncbi:MAG: hypothetical protein JSR41_04750 [Proteobacteria bacterium]|nr:hypothetical protein [Pseudomonadota bacterium]
MPVVALIIELLLLIVTVDEAVTTLEDLFEEYKKYRGSLEDMKKEIRKMLESLEKEIAKKIDEKEEVALLLAMTEVDPQGQQTRKAEGRGADGNVISAAIRQKIPFRDVITKICTLADKIPPITLRKHKGVQIKDLPQAKRKVLEELLGRSIKELTEQEAEQFILVRLKQLAVNLLFEFIDECLDWASPLKCEEAFGPPPKFEDHPVVGSTRLKRIGKASPFYPSPFQYQKGSIAADLVIQEYRHQRPDKSNIFAIVEIKFQGDRIEAKQFEQYQRLLREAAVVKTARTSIRYMDKVVNSGGRLSLLRFPEDVAVHGAKPDPEKKDEARKDPDETARKSRSKGDGKKRGKR